MKKNVMVILLLLFIFGCNKDYETESLFKIANNSSHSVELKVFGVIHVNGQKLTDTTFKIPISQNITISYILKTDKRKVTDDPITEPFIPSDSAHIIFDDTFRIIYKPDISSPHNILRKSSYTGGKADRRYFEYLFTITDEDYKNAVKIK